MKKTTAVRKTGAVLSAILLSALITACEGYTSGSSYAVSSNTVSEEPEIAEENAVSLYGNPSIEEQVIYDESDAVITATDLVIDGNTGNVLLLLKLENKTDQDLMVTGDVMYVNGLTVDSAVYAEAAPGQTEEHGSVIMGSSLKVNGIENIGTIEMVLRGINGDFEDVFRTELLTVKTSLDGSFEQAMPEPGESLKIESTDKNAAADISAAYNGFSPLGELDNESSYAQFYLENNSKDKSYYIYGLSPKVNGTEITGSMSQILRPGKRGIVLYGIYNEFLETEGIENIEEFSGTIEVVEGEGYEADKEVGTINFSIKPGDPEKAVSETVSDNAETEPADKPETPYETEVSADSVSADSVSSDSVSAAHASTLSENKDKNTPGSVSTD